MWYHHQLQQASQSRYKDAKTSLHDTLTHYFGKIVDAESMAVQCVTAQPLVFTPDNMAPAPAVAADFVDSVWYVHTRIN